MSLTFLKKIFPIEIIHNLALYFFPIYLKELNLKNIEYYIIYCRKYERVSRDDSKNWLIEIEHINSKLLFLNCKLLQSNPKVLNILNYVKNILYTQYKNIYNEIFYDYTIRSSLFGTKYGNDICEQLFFFFNLFNEFREDSDIIVFSHLLDLDNDYVNKIKLDILPTLYKIKNIYEHELNEILIQKIKLHINELIKNINQLKLLKFKYILYNTDKEKQILNINNFFKNIDFTKKLSIKQIFKIKKKINTLIKKYNKYVNNQTEQNKVLKEFDIKNLNKEQQLLCSILKKSLEFKEHNILSLFYFFRAHKMFNKYWDLKI